MKIGHPVLIPFVVAIGTLMSCKKNSDPDPVPVPGTTIDTTGPLKTTASFPIGMAIDYELFKNNASYKNLVVQESDQVSFTYHMKHGAIARDDGSFDFAKADGMVQLSTAAGLKIFGHTLVWHQNQNGNYLRSLTTGAPDPNAPNLFAYGDLEAGTGTTGTGSALFTGWNVLIGGSASGSYSAVAGNGSSRAMQATVNTAGTNAYDMQAIGPEWQAVTGEQYKVSIDIKASAGGGKVRLVNQNSQYQQFEITPTTTWETYNWVLTALENSPSFRLNFPNAGVYTIDNITIRSASGGPAPQPQEIRAGIDSALSRFIRTSMMRYAGKVHAWDVVNEPMDDGNPYELKTGVGRELAEDEFYWQDYLGKDYAVRAFQLARQYGNPDDILFINDYNLEYNLDKCRGIIDYVEYIESNGVTVDGIGTQMHISIDSDKDKIVEMFTLLAATGKMIKISELDLGVGVPISAATTEHYQAQADMYKFVIEKYFEIIPASQQYGITFWSPIDSPPNSAWRPGEPIGLWNQSYTRKRAYAAAAEAIEQ